MPFSSVVGSGAGGVERRAVNSMFVPPPTPSNSHTEALIPSVMVLGGGPVGGSRSLGWSPPELD